MITYSILCVICFWVCYGILFAHYSAIQPNDDQRENRGFSILISLMLCPFLIIGVLICYLVTGFAKNRWKI